LSTVGNPMRMMMLVLASATLLPGLCIAQPSFETATRNQMQHLAEQNTRQIEFRQRLAQEPLHTRLQDYFGPSIGDRPVYRGTPEKIQLQARPVHPDLEIAIDTIRGQLVEGALMPLGDAGRLGASLRWGIKLGTEEWSALDVLDIFVKLGLKLTVALELLKPIRLGDAYPDPHEFPPIHTLKLRPTIPNHNTPTDLWLIWSQDLDRDEVERLERFERYIRTAEFDRPEVRHTHVASTEPLN
jgi:hypothetical protein